MSLFAALRVASSLLFVSATLACASAPDSEAVSAAGASGQGTTIPPESGEELAQNDLLLKARIRRLSNVEYRATLTSLLGETTLSVELPPDTRHDHYTTNSAQVADPVWADEVATVAEALAHEVVSTRLTTFVPCSAEPTRECADDFISTFVPLAFRRPLDAVEKSELLELFDAGMSSAGFAEGIELVLRATLQAPSFLYLTELGTTAAGSGYASTALTDHEIAANLSYLLSGRPPDATLVAAAEAGELRHADARIREVTRLLAQPGSQEQLTRFVKEWLAIDDLERIGKDASYANYEALRPHMMAESNAFIAEVLFNDDATVGTLIGADFTLAPAELATFYGLAKGSGRLPLTDAPRRGLLHQAAFLAAHSNVNDSGPVKRGKTVLTRVLCQSVPDPSSAGVLLMVPAPDPSLSTRQRFAAHSSDPFCSGCHKLIDPLGFAFENYDAIGAYRETDNGHAIDASGAIPDGLELSGPVANSVELVTKLASSKELEQCFARQFSRFASGQSDTTLEQAFIERVWQALPEEDQGNLLQIVAAYVKSDAFIYRSMQ